MNESVDIPADAYGVSCDGINSDHFKTFIEKVSKCTNLKHLHLGGRIGSSFKSEKTTNLIAGIINGVNLKNLTYLGLEHGCLDSCDLIVLLSAIGPNTLTHVTLQNCSYYYLEEKDKTEKKFEFAGLAEYMNGKMLNYEEICQFLELFGKEHVRYYKIRDATAAMYTVVNNLLNGKEDNHEIFFCEKDFNDVLRHPAMATVEHLDITGLRLVNYEDKDNYKFNFENMKGLKHLDMTNCDFPTSSMANLMKSLAGSSLEELILYEAFGLSDMKIFELCEHIDLPKLKVLSLEWNDFGEEGKYELEKLKKREGYSSLKIKM